MTFLFKNLSTRKKKFYLQMQKVHVISKSDNKMLQTFHVGFLLYFR